jgi:hypothetical protein
VYGCGAVAIWAFVIAAVFLIVLGVMGSRALRS